MTDVAARTYGLQHGTPDLKSIGPITFGPDAILFVADNASATIYAIDLAPWSEPSTSTEPVAIEHVVDVRAERAVVRLDEHDAVAHRVVLVFDEPVVRVVERGP